MTDPVGVALGVPGLIGLFYSTALEGYQIIASAQALDNYFKEYKHQFRIQNERLKDWAASLNGSTNDGLQSQSARATEFFEEHPDKKELTIKTLHEIAELFTNVKILHDLYGITAAQSTNPFLDSIPPVSATIEDLNLPPSLLSNTKSPKELKSIVSSYARLKWAFSDKEKLQSLIDKLKQYNEELESLTAKCPPLALERFTPTPSDKVSSKIHFMVPFSKNADYIRQSQIRSFMESKLRDQGSTGVTQITVALCGLGGAGLAKQVEIPGFEENDSTQDVKQLVKLWLEGDRSSNWVLVLDNADNRSDFFPSAERSDVSSSDPSANLARYVPRASKGTVIITTRDFSVARQLAGPKGVLRKVEMDPNESEELFKQHYPSGSPYNGSDCAQLLQELQYLPLAVTQVAAYFEMLHPMLTPSQYLQKFKSTKEDQQRLLSKLFHNPWRPGISGSPNAEIVLTAFTITFSQIQHQSPLANSILRLKDREYP
ncbi:Similar to kinesin light chain [Grosmannia clavigera kw1407]; acc. no. EFW99948 [Pyronema omphalodes CBS 100304]|uniref:Similar to kinesin light chain [Grosmannia clavigera kw1407] acc. no. EFW99948 n=1 Tax=Pyronema omphalodes (strain CBS 100304) TaxID=1076935 RepID=U4LIY0_PYROM|nr:Similar to kinesin light chain [Grosmannia clavigera kw1407]; acc. no. EFW99948 [Pyronema omphalodes CBS 100304]